ncbi:AEC family transporter [Butyrivibrio sp. VCD2006]|uniref:AEC family transporter n=1 Tax=Butyrivibrio sp. VCD2006 TaxID=1280664 RepID=UPI00041556C3|nr:AEC family transporter [Butyrivibrio sp. VCD2006]
MVMLKQMIILFILMGVGIICRKTKIMNDAVSKGMSAIVVNIASPAFILSAGINQEETIAPNMLVANIAVTVVIYAWLIFLAILLPKLLKVEEEHVGTYRIMTIFSNIGFMGFPIVLASYGETGLMYAAMFQFPYNLLIYTYGVSVMQKSSGAGKENVKFQWSKIFNVGVIAVFLSVLLFILKIRVPSSIESVVDTIAGLTVPLSMMVIGYSLSGMKLGKLFSDKRLMVFSLIKLIIIPLISILVLHFFITDPILLGVCFIMVATPVGSMTAMFAEAYDGDKETASMGVALTTLLSVITIPLCNLYVQSLL